MFRKILFIISSILFATNLAWACPNVVYAYCDSNYKQIATNTSTTSYHGAGPECETQVTVDSAWSARPEDTAYMVYGNGADWVFGWYVGFYGHCKDGNDGGQCSFAGNQTPNGYMTSWAFDGLIANCSEATTIPPRPKTPRTSSGKVTITR